MHFGGFVFRPGLWPTLAGLFFFALTLWLGNWQLSRADYKRELQARYAFLSGQEIFIDNRVYKTRAGYHVLTPFLIEGSSQHVLVNRGWVALVRRAVISNSRARSRRGGFGRTWISNATGASSASRCSR